MKRWISCAHDKVYSGQTNLSQHYAYICITCGQCGWDDSIDIARVDWHRYCHLRVMHGWATPERLPSPPRVPTETKPAAERPAWPFVHAQVFFCVLALFCALSSIPWGPLGPIMPFWMALIGTGLALGTATVAYVAWRKGW